MAAAGVPMRTLQEWMGHRNLATTEIYADYAPDPAYGAAFAERMFTGHRKAEKEGTERARRAWRVRAKELMMQYGRSGVSDASCSSAAPQRSIPSQRPNRGVSSTMDTTEQLDRGERERIRLRFFREHGDHAEFSSVSVRRHAGKTSDWCV